LLAYNQIDETMNKKGLNTDGGQSYASYERRRKSQDESVPPLLPRAMMYDHAEAEAVDAVVASRSPLRFYGPDLQGKTKAFEKEFSSYLSVRHAVGVTSGTAAVICALKAANVGPGIRSSCPRVRLLPAPVPSSAPEACLSLPRSTRA
jgi:hypothetical protein